MTGKMGPWAPKIPVIWGLGGGGGGGGQFRGTPFSLDTCDGCGLRVLYS